MSVSESAYCCCDKRLLSVSEGTVVIFSQVTCTYVLHSLPLFFFNFKCLDLLKIWHLSSSVRSQQIKGLKIGEKHKHDGSKSRKLLDFWQCLSATLQLSSCHIHPMLIGHNLRNSIVPCVAALSMNAKLDHLSVTRCAFMSGVVGQDITRQLTPLVGKDALVSSFRAAWWDLWFISSPFPPNTVVINDQH